jgi:hypothetical protein
MMMMMIAIFYNASFGISRVQRTGGRLLYIAYSLYVSFARSV